jgi:DNA invertase Pin-like site-specific DNA recombinase
MSTMSTMSCVETPITAQHRARLAYVYVRQSSPGQVARHGESTELQYRLVARAVAPGWPRERVRVIDDDLGQSAAAAGRLGFQHLIAEIGLGHAGLVVSLDASRLARNNGEWHRLVELCGLFGTLIADGERLYGPGAYHDRLLLGLSGMLSEAELHQLKLRLHAGARQKAERGELRLPLPVGLVRRADGTVSLDPDQEIEARIRLVFQKFAELGAARAVMRYLRRARLPLPVRPRRGPEPHPVGWEPARTSRVLGLLKNPAYAGAHVYGRTAVDPTRRRPGQRYSGTVRRPPDEWPICLRDAHPAYIRWEEFVRNQARLRANRSRYYLAQPGVPRRGRALLQRIARCGRCGGWMGLGYSGRRGRYPVYRCAGAKGEFGATTCQEVRAAAVDAAVEAALLAAVAPDQVAPALAALEELEAEDRALERQWQLRLERARHEATRAERQYTAVEPENRLVARTLERQWEERLRAVEEVEQAYERWRHQPSVTLAAADRAAILALGEDFPAIWHAPTTTPADRKRLLRLVIRDVLLDQRRARGQAWVQINWQTGATTAQWIRRRVLGYDQHADLETLRQRVRALHAAGHVDAEIAATLNAEGFQTAHGRPFNGRATWYLRRTWGLPPVAATPSGALVVEERIVAAEEAARLIGVQPPTVYKWLRAGRLPGAQRRTGPPWKVVVSPGIIEAMRAHVARARRIKRCNKLVI